MQKYLPVAGMIALLISCWTVQNNFELSDKEKYNRLFESRWNTVLTMGQFPNAKGFTNPKKAMEFDRLKRIDPKTGKIPEFALMDAWQNAKTKADADTRGVGIQWEERGPTNVGGRTRAIMFDPNDPTHKALFAGGVGGGIWRTADITETSPTWVNLDPMFGNVAVTCITAEPASPNYIYLGTGEGYNNADAIRGAGIWRSSDAGTTWDVLPATQNSNYYYTQKMAADPEGGVYAGTDAGLFKTIDHGDTWFKVGGGGFGMTSAYVSDVEFDSDGNLFVAFRGDGIYRSEASFGVTQGDSGTYTKMDIPFNAGIDRIEFTVSEGNPDFMYAVSVDNSMVDRYYRSEDGGDNWVITAGEPNAPDFSNGQAWYDLTIAAHPTLPGTVISGAVPNYRSTNKGDSWGILFAFMHVDQHNVIYQPENPLGSSSPMTEVFIILIMAPYLLEIKIQDTMSLNSMPLPSMQLLVVT